MYYRQAYIFAFVAIVLYLMAQSPESMEWLGAQATMIARPIFGPILNLVNQQAFIYVTSLLIVLAAIVLTIYYYVFAVRPQRKRYRKLLLDVCSLPLPLKAGGPEVEVALEGLGTTLVAHNMFVTAFEEWDGDRRSRGRFPAARFQDYADRSRMERGETGVGLFAALPSIFTSVGLILTFVGLVVSLYFAARGFRSGNFEEARQAIIQLLNAASFKFLTSVAALFGSLMITLTLRLTSAGTEVERQNTLDAINTWLRHWKNEDAKAPNTTLIDILGRLEATISQLQARLPA